MKKFERVIQLETKLFNDRIIRTIQVSPRKFITGLYKSVNCTMEEVQRFSGKTNKKDAMIFHEMLIQQTEK